MTLRAVGPNGFKDPLRTVRSLVPLQSRYWCLPSPCWTQSSWAMSLLYDTFTINNNEGHELGVEYLWFHFVNLFWKALQRWRTSSWSQESWDRSVCLVLFKEEQLLLHQPERSFDPAAALRSKWSPRTAGGAGRLCSSMYVDQLNSLTTLEN